MFPPKELEGKIDEYKILAPPNYLRVQFKRGNLTVREFEEKYRKDVLSKLSAVKVYNDLKGKVLLCHENPSEFCHRKIVAKWIEEITGNVVEELK